MPIRDEIRKLVTPENATSFLTRTDSSDTRRKQQLQNIRRRRTNNVSEDVDVVDVDDVVLAEMTRQKAPARTPGLLTVPTDRRHTLIPSADRPRSGSVRLLSSRRMTLSSKRDSRRESVTSSGSQDSKSRAGSFRSRSKRKSSSLMDSEEQNGRAKRLLIKWRLAAKMIIAAGHLIKKHIRTCDYIGSPYLKQLESIDQIASLGIDRNSYLFFDPADYKANKQMKLSYEAKRILTKRPLYRTEQEIYYAMLALRSVPSIADYPVRMQRRLAQWGSFESFEPKRIIVRQGDPPFAFYFILYGSVLVCLLNEDQSEARTVCYLHRSDSFGELAIVNGSNRQSTVISKTYLEMLTISDEAYQQIFMVGGSRTINDPDHEQFMRSLEFLNTWPRELLVNDPKRFMFCYFQRNAVMARNTNCSKWIFIVKSGSVSLLMKLIRTSPEPTAKLGFIDRPATAYSLRASPFGGSTIGDVISVLAQYNRRPLTSGDRPGTVLTAGDRPGTVLTVGDRPSSRPGTVLTARQMRDKRRPRTTGGEDAKSPIVPARKRHGTTKKPLVPVPPLLPKQNPSGVPNERRTIYDDLDAAYNDQDRELTAADVDPQFVLIRTLTKGMTFGLENLMFDEQPSMSLVSNGAECILLSKQFYMEHSPQELVDKLRIQVSPFPPVEQLQDKLLTRLNWDSYKNQNICDAVHNRRRRRSQNNY